MRRSLLPAAVALAGAALLPWTTGTRQHWFDPHPDAPGVLFWLIGLLVAAAVVAVTDPWLGALIGWIALSTCWALPQAGALVAATQVALGAVMILSVWRLRPRARAVVMAVLVAVGILQVAYMALQSMGVDPLWPTRPLEGRLPGTFGNATWLGNFLGVAVALAPLWAIPILVAGVLLAGSKAGLVAAAVGLALRYRRVWWRAIAAPVALLACGLALTPAVGPEAFAFSSSWRLRAWDLGARVWLERSPLVGLGPGSWWHLVPDAQDRVGLFPTERIIHAHNDLLQLGFEGGVVALVLVAGWLVVHRRAFLAGPAGAALAAVFVTALVGFPFRVAGTAAMNCLVIGLALAAERRRA